MAPKRGMFPAPFRNILVHLNMCETIDFLNGTTYLFNHFEIILRIDMIGFQEAMKVRYGPSGICNE